MLFDLDFSEIVVTMFVVLVVIGSALQSVVARTMGYESVKATLPINSRVCLRSL